VDTGDRIWGHREAVLHPSRATIGEHYGKKDIDLARQYFKQGKTPVSYFTRAPTPFDVGSRIVPEVL
jgi:hypothetical protein